MVKVCLRFVFKILYRVEVKGLEHYHQAGTPLIIVANHVSFLDPVLLGAFLPLTPTYAINSRIAQVPFIKFACTLLANVFEMDPTSPLSSKALIKYLKQGHRAIIFPEGRISTTGNLMKIYDGTGMIAEKSGAMVLPVRVDGAQYTPFAKCGDHFRKRWFPKITLTVLPAQKIMPPDDITSSRERREASSQLLGDLMADMMFETSHYRQDIFSALLEARQIHGGKSSIIEDIKREPLNYDHFIARSLLVGNLLSGLTEKNETIGVLLPNSTAHACVLFGLFANQRVPAILNISVGINALLSACEIAMLNIVVTSKQFIEAADLQGLITAMAEKVHVVYLEELCADITHKDKLKALWIGKTAKYTHAKKTILPDDPAVILFTSGSEGTPKGVVLSHANLLANREQISTCCDFSGQDIVLNALPMFHSFGLTAGTLLPILYGMKVFLYPSPLHYKIVPEYAYESAATIFFGTNTFLRGYAKHAHPYDFNAVRYVFAGAEKLQQETRDTWMNKFGIRVFEGYGATETSPALSLNTPMHHQAGSVGRLLPGISYQLETVEGIEEGKRLHVAGPNIMLGYRLHDNPQILVPPKSMFGKGWYDTGDIVSIDEYGFLHILGRAKRFAKIGGEMVSLAVTEQLATKTWPDAVHAAVSVPDAAKGERIILITTQSDATRNQLCKNAAGVCELNLPKLIISSDHIPLLASGKIDYSGVSILVSEHTDT
ncbi:MAG TPA: acyl-[ACP]--phospholipid O-acyltransferase [Crenotrichaceae bacterium]|nr:acyl-[ACP]--phospholipid O-acyltransferase [Crenotrichaceae bacterium]